MGGGRLAGKVAVVVGGGQTPGEGMGNGRATAIRFAQEGATVLVVDKDPNSAAETVEMMGPDAGESSVLAADITSEADCESIAATAVERYRSIDVLHNNVGIGTGDTSTSKMTPAVWDHIFDVNLKGVMMTCTKVLPVMRKAGSGAIVNISSIAAVCAANIVAYKTSKAALNAYTHALATGNARYGIRANAIMPGLMNTPMAIEGYVTAGHDREQLVARRNAQVPLGRTMGDAWDVANAALFLASDEARFITGVNLAVDGGQSAMIG